MSARTGCWPRWPVRSVFWLSSRTSSRERIAAGFDWATNSFTLLYTLLTGFHFLHVVVGAIVFTLLWRKARAGAYGRANHMAPASGAVFWHMVDLLWMVLFPLVYVIR